MNFLELVQRTAVECGASGVAPSTVIGQSGETQRIVQWVNSAWVDIQSIHQDWQWLRTTCAFPTIQGQAIYPTSLCNTNNFGMWARNTFRNYANVTLELSISFPCVATLATHGLSVGDTAVFTTTGALPTGITSGTTYYVVSVPTANTFTFSLTPSGSEINTSGTQSGTHTITTDNTIDFVGLKSEIFMAYNEYEIWRDTYEYGNFRFTATRPFTMSISPSKAICLGPVPAEGYTVLGDYYTTPTELQVDSDTPVLPFQHHMIIVYRAMMFYGGYEGAGDVYQRGELEYKKIIKRLEADRLPDIMIGPALA